jgi:hypothetical protein
MHHHGNALNRCNTEWLFLSLRHHGPVKLAANHGMMVRGAWDLCALTVGMVWGKVLVAVLACWLSCPQFPAQLPLTNHDTAVRVLFGFGPLCMLRPCISRGA